MVKSNWKGLIKTLKNSLKKTYNVLEEFEIVFSNIRR